MIFIRIAAIALLAACIQTALSAESAKGLKKSQRIENVVTQVTAKYSAFLELCQQDHVKNGLMNPKDLLPRQKEVLFMELFPVVNSTQALDFVDILKDIKKISKAAHKAGKLHLVDQQAYLYKASMNLKLYYAFARKFSGTYRFMYEAAKLNCAVSKELPLFANDLEVAPAKTIALAHTTNRKAKFPILDYVHQLDLDLARLYKMQKRSLKDGVREYAKNVIIQGELLQNEIIKTSDYAIERRMHELAHPVKSYEVLKVFGGIYLASIAATLLSSIIRSLAF